LLEAKEEMPGVQRKHKKVLSKLSLETLARLGHELEVEEDLFEDEELGHIKKDCEAINLEQISTNHVWKRR